MANTLNLGDGNWATKKDSLLGYNSENNNFKPLPFDFTRSSSATRINKNGKIETINSGEPKIDFLGNTKGTLLLEPSRTNLFLNSEPTSNENASGGITYESFNWFLGFSNCIKFGDDSSLRFRYGATVSATTQHTISAFVIMDDLSEPLVGVSSVTGDFAFVCGGVTGGVANENIYYGNNIYRVSTTLTSGTNANNSGIIKYTSQSSKGFRVVGLQIEQGSYATSYIPTQGSAVTRSAEVTNGAGNTSTFNDSQGVLYAEVKGFEEVPSNSAYITISSPSVSFTNAAVLQFRNNGDLRFYFGGNASENIQFIDSSIDLKENNKIAVQYDSVGSNYKMFVNGVSISRYVLATNQSVSGLSELNLNYISLRLLSEVKDVRVYNNSLTDAQLQALTQ